MPLLAIKCDADAFITLDFTSRGGKVNNARVTAPPAPIALSVPHLRIRGWGSGTGCHDESAGI